MAKYILYVLLALFPGIAIAAPERFALVDSDGKVQNVTVIEPGAKYDPPDGTRLVRDASNVAVPGGSYSMFGGFSPPSPPLKQSQLSVAVSPVDKLKKFLDSNPDVASLLGTTK